MMISKLPAVTILIVAATWAGFAVWLGLSPGALMSAFGVDVSTPAMLTEVRAFYGGVEMAIAVAMFVLWRRGDSFASLLVGGLPLLGSALGRCFGMLADGFSTMHLGFAALEIVAAGLCFFGCTVVAGQSRNADAAS